MTPVELDPIQKIREANPVPDDQVAGSVGGREARDLLHRIAEKAPGTPRRSLPPARAWGPIALATTVLLAIFVASVRPGRPPAGSTETTPERTSVVLEHIAAVAEMRPAETIPAGRFRYTRSETRYMTSTVGEHGLYSVIAPTVREIWVAEDGEGRIRTEVKDVEFLTSEDRRAWEAAGAPALHPEGTSDQRFQGGDPGRTSLYFERFDGLPADPDQLYDVIAQRAQGAGHGLHPEMFVVVGDLLRETGAPPEVRAALFRVAARIPGVEVKESVEDPKGRPGVAVSITYDPGGRRMKDELIFDPQTSELLSEGQYVLEKTPAARPTGISGDRSERPPDTPVADVYRDLPSGTRVGGAVYLESGVVGSVEERPGR